MSNLYPIKKILKKEKNKKKRDDHLKDNIKEIKIAYILHF